MRQRTIQAFAVVFGPLLVLSAMFGSAVMFDSDVSTVDDFADDYVASDAQAFGGIVTAAVIGAVAGGAVSVAADHFLTDGTVNETALAEADALETETAIHTSAATKVQDWRTFSQTMDNYLNDTRSIALMEGKNAYIKALNNGSSEAAARNAATEAVADYYAVKQLQLIASWNGSGALVNHSVQLVENDSNIPNDYVDVNHVNPDAGSVSGTWDGAKPVSVTLVNATSVPVLGYEIHESGTSPEVDTWTPVRGDTTIGAPGAVYKRVLVRPPNSNFDQVTVVDFSEYANQWTRIEEQNTEVQGQLDAFVDATYQDYVAGEINTSQLVDPYLGAREYSPEGSSFNTWALRTFSAMGIEPPQNLSNMGKMTISTPGYSYEGILMSGSQPDGGFAIGEQYNASELDGAQWLVTTGGQTHQLESTFTVESAQRVDGSTYEQNETIVYKTIEYGTTNTSEYQALLEQVTNLTKEINERQEEQRSAPGGGGFGPIGQQTVAVLIAAGLAVALIMGRE